MRRIAREAITFALLGQLVTTAWVFVTGGKANRSLARGIAARAVHGELYGAGIVQGGNDVWLSDGTRLTVRFCASNSDTNCREDRDHVERDYWAAYKADRDRRSGVLVSLIIGLVGFPGGLICWGFYWLIYFALKGLPQPKANPPVAPRQCHFSTLTNPQLQPTPNAPRTTPSVPPPAASEPDGRVRG